MFDTKQIDIVWSWDTTNVTMDSKDAYVLDANIMVNGKSIGTKGHCFIGSIKTDISLTYKNIPEDRYIKEMIVSIGNIDFYCGRSYVMENHKAIVFIHIVNQGNGHYLVSLTSEKYSVSCMLKQSLMGSELRFSDTVVPYYPYKKRLFKVIPVMIIKNNQIFIDMNKKKPKRCSGSKGGIVKRTLKENSDMSLF